MLVPPRENICIRPYHTECAQSHLISDTKQGQAWWVLGWENAAQSAGPWCIILNITGEVLICSCNCWFYLHLTDLGIWFTPSKTFSLQNAKNIEKLWNKTFYTWLLHTLLAILIAAILCTCRWINYVFGNYRIHYI